MCIDGRCTANQQVIADAFNKHITMIPDKINIINNNYILSITSDNIRNMYPYSLSNVFQKSFPSIKYICTTTKEIENIIMSLKSSNSSGYDEVSTNILKACFPYITSPLNYICNRDGGLA